MPGVSRAAGFTSAARHAQIHMKAACESDDGAGMKRRGGVVLLYLRLILVILLVSWLSDGPRVKSSTQSEFIAKVTGIPGQLALVIQKSRHVLTLYKGMTPVKSYWAAFGKGYASGDKRRKGDKRTPEGKFYICSLNHSERFYKFIGLSYPGLRHANEGLARGIISRVEYNEIARAIAERRQPPWDTALGGAIGIHGRLTDAAVKYTPRPENWTDGCIALNNQDVDEIFSVVSLGTPVYILP